MFSRARRERFGEERRKKGKHICRWKSARHIVLWVSIVKVHGWKWREIGKHGVIINFYFVILETIDLDLLFLNFLSFENHRAQRTIYFHIKRNNIDSSIDFYRRIKLKVSSKFHRLYDDKINVSWKEEQVDPLILWHPWVTGTVQYVSLIKYLRFTSSLFKIFLVSNSCLLSNLGTNLALIHFHPSPKNISSDVVEMVSLMKRRWLQEREM